MKVVKVLCLMTTCAFLMAMDRLLPLKLVTKRGDITFAQAVMSIYALLNR